MPRKRLADPRRGGLTLLQWALLVFWSGEVVALGLLARMYLSAATSQGTASSAFPFLICVAWLGMAVMLVWTSRDWWSCAGQSCSAVLSSPQRYGMPRVVLRRPGTDSETAVVTGHWNVGGILLLSLAQGPDRRRGMLVLPFQARSPRVVRAARLAIAVAREVQPVPDNGERYC